MSMLFDYQLRTHNSGSDDARTRSKSRIFTASSRSSGCDGTHGSPLGIDEYLWKRVLIWAPPDGVVAKEANDRITAIQKQMQSRKN